jgi:hypothetical protein
MAVNQSRSMTNDFNDGSTDGKYRKVRPNTVVAPGMGEQIVIANRSDLNPYWNYDFIDQEDTSKVNPAGDSAKTSVPKKSDPLSFIWNDQMGANY